MEETMERHQMQQMISKNDKYIDICLKVFVGALALSGLCCFSLPFLSRRILTFLDALAIRGEFYSFAIKMLQGAKYNAAHYPFISYGTDWLGFAHLMFALLFVGAIMDPYKNEWVIRFGLIVCTLLVPTVLIAGAIREIPIVWRMINCAMGGVGFLLLFRVFKWMKANEELRRQLEELNQKKVNPEIRVA